MNKKIISILGCALILLALIVTGCGKAKNAQKQAKSNEETTLGYHVHVDENGETHIHYNSDSEHEHEHAVEETTLGYHVHVDENGETHIHYNSDSEHEHEHAVEEKNNKGKNSNKSNEFNQSSAVEKVQSYSMKKLGIKGNKSDYKFLVGSEMSKIKGKKCFEVAVSTMKKNKDGTVYIKPAKTFYVTKDGKKVYYKNLKTGKYDELK